MATKSSGTGITKAKMGSVRTAAPSRDGLASKGKTKGKQVKMSPMGKPLGMKKGGMTKKMNYGGVVHLEYEINADTARKIIDKCIEIANKANMPITVFILSPTGQIVASHRMDGQVPSPTPMIGTSLDSISVMCRSGCSLASRSRIISSGLSSKHGSSKPMRRARRRKPPSS